MSGIAAIFDLEHATDTDRHCQLALETMAYRGPDGLKVWQAGNGMIALGHCAMFTDAGQRETPQPHLSPDGTLAITMDGYLANNEELARDLRQRGHVLRGTSDAEIALSAYRQWGETCCSRFDGEYAFVLWDSVNQRLLAARDHQGMRPLHYHWSGTRLIIASDIAGVLANLAGNLALDRSFLTEIIANQYLSRGDTIWQGVKRLPPATVMTFAGRDLRRQTHWSAPLGVTIRHKTTSDYVEHYLEVFKRCIERASRSDRPLACEVSGGLDSTGVFALADRLSREGNLRAPDLKGYSFLAEAGSRADEIAYARSVAGHLGRSIEEVPMFIPPTSWFEEQSRRDRDFPTYCNTAILITLGEKMVTDGSRIALNGQGGDIWLFGSPFAYHEMLRHGEPRRLVTTLRHGIKKSGFAAAARQALHFGLRPFAPGLYDRLRLRREAKSADKYDWIAQPWRSELIDRMAAAKATHRGRPYDYYKQSKLEMGFLSRFFEIFTRQSARIGFEPRSPMLSKEFIGFCAATPEYTRHDGHYGKALHREAMSGLLPEDVRLRTDFAEFSQVYDRHADWTVECLENQQQDNIMELLERPDALALAKGFCTAPIDARNAWELWGITGSLILSNELFGPGSKGY